MVASVFGKILLRQNNLCVFYSEEACGIFSKEEIKEVKVRSLMAGGSENIA